MADGGSDRERVLAVLETIRSGAPEDLARHAGIVAGFPQGRDPWLGIAWLVHAVAAGNEAVAAWMMVQGADPDAPAEDGFPALHACLDLPLPARHRMLRLLLAAGTDPGQRGANDWTPLHRAAAAGDLRALAILIAAGADPAARSRIDDGATAEEEARTLGHHAAADFLRSRG
jgi:hypothetical protein